MRSARAAEFATSVLSIELIAPNHCKLIPAFSSLHFGCIFFIIAFWVHFLVFFSDCWWITHLHHQRHLYLMASSQVWWINYPGYQLSHHLRTICQASQLWTNRPNHVLDPPSHTHTPTIYPLLSNPLDLSSTLGFPFSFPKLFWKLLYLLLGKCCVSCLELGIPHNMHELVCKDANEKLKSLLHRLSHTRREFLHIFTRPRPNLHPK